MSFADPNRHTPYKNQFYLFESDKKIDSENENEPAESDADLIRDIELECNSF